MDKDEGLRILYDRVMNKVFEYSANYLMTIPKKGYEKQWQQETELAEVIKGLMV